MFDQRKTLEHYSWIPHSQLPAGTRERFGIETIIVWRKMVKAIAHDLGGLLTDAQLELWARHYQDHDAHVMDWQVHRMIRGG